MSELINISERRVIRWRLLSTASTLTLLASIYAAGQAEAANDDNDRPILWIELGGQLEHVGGEGDNFPVGFLAANPTSPVLRPVSPFRAQNPPPFSFGEEGKISLKPESSDWIFSASVRVGRSNNSKEVDHQTNGVHYLKYDKGVPAGNVRGTDDFADTRSFHQESHVTLDFSAGKDVGLGLFGADSSSVLGLGVRFAQFTSRTTLDLRARPDLHFKYAMYGTVKIPLPHFHTYHLTGNASRSFHGVGPTLSWDGSIPVIGNSQDDEITFNWGVNAAILFGKQRARVRHQESGHYQSSLAHFERPSSEYALIYQHSGAHSGVRTVTIPNVGGFAGASYRIENFKVNLGYRADFFFGAIDGGIDTHKSETLGFYGPFATISIGFP